MNTILPKFVDFNNKTAFKPIKHFYNNVDHHAFYMIGVLIFAILLAILIQSYFFDDVSYSPYDFLMNVVLGFSTATLTTITAKMPNNLIRILLYIGYVIIFILLLIAYLDMWHKFLPKEHRLRVINICEVVFVTIGAAIITVTGFMYFNDKNNTENYTMNVAKYNTSGFKVANTNLIASPYKISTKHKSANNLDPTNNYHKDNYYIYVDLVNPKPKGILTKQITYKTPINMQTMKSSQDENSSNRKTDVYYLGQMKNGHFIPNYQNIRVTYAFMDYQKYIKTHQLENRFKHNFSFEVSYKYFTENRDPALIVVGDNGFNLHYANAKSLSYSKIVQSEKL